VAFAGTAAAPTSAVVEKNRRAACSENVFQHVPGRDWYSKTTLIDCGTLVADASRRSGRLACASPALASCGSVRRMLLRRGREGFGVCVPMEASLHNGAVTMPT